MTTDTARLLAAYNAHANMAMDKILAGLDPASWVREMGGYFGSIRKLCAHIYIADQVWLRRFVALRPFDVSADPVLASPFDKDNDPFDNLSGYLARRTELDEVFTAFAAELRDDDLASPLSYRNWAGKEQERNFGGLLLHLCNHQTHHRGGISLYLDILGVENDFSNLSELL